MRCTVKNFLIIQGILYMIVISSDIGNYLTADWSNGIKLFSVFVCIMYLLITFKPGISGHDHLLMIGVIAATILADAILLFSNHLVLGVLVFVGVQFLYAFRIAWFSQTKICYRYYIGGIAVIVGVSFIIRNNGLLVAVAIFYGILFAVNLMHLLIASNDDRQKYVLFITGYVLFLICDINVLFFNILPNYAISNLFYEFTRVSMWFFYLPAQVLLSLSAVSGNSKFRIR